MTARDVGHSSWSALGTTVQLHVVDRSELPRASARARDVLDEVDLSCSRFRADSDLVHANRRPGRWTPVSPVLVGAVRVALEAARETGGRVDPSLGAAMEAAGYDRTFELLSRASDLPTALPGVVRPGAWQEIEVRSDAIFVPHGVRLDLGATGKAYAADLVAADLATALDAPAAISVGGDVAVTAAPHHLPHSWPVVVGETRTDLIERPDETVSLALQSGGVATSTVRARRWMRGGRSWHHVLDPANGLPVAGPWRSVTALGRSCSAANTATTAALVLGADARAWLEDRDVAALLVDEHDVRHPTSAWLAATLDDASVANRRLHEGLR
ncbi:MAG: FAD:protein FMN transferase [Pedococcus sp.]